MREEYLELHRAVWPHVEAVTRAAGLRNFTIWVHDDVLVGYYEYDGDDLAAAQARMDADPVMQDWWARTGACQLPFDPASSALNWIPLQEAWHQD
jgi:L-rhamnose mutarotase